MGHAAGEEYLVVLLLNAAFVDEHELGDERPYLERFLSVQVGNVANDQVFAVVPQGSAPFEETADIVVTIGQCD